MTPTTQQPPNPNPLLTVRQVAAQLGISPTAVYQLCDSGRLPHYRLDNGKKRRPYRVKQSEVTAFLERSEGRPIIQEPAVRPYQRQQLHPQGFRHLKKSRLKFQPQSP